MLGHIFVGLKQVSVANSNLASSPSTKFHVLLLSELEEEKNHVQHIPETALFAHTLLLPAN